MSRQTKTRPLDLGIDATRSQHKRNRSEDTRISEPEVAPTRVERQLSSARFFRVNELAKITVSFIKKLSIEELRTIDPRIVIVRSPAGNAYVGSPPPHSIGVPKDRVADIIQQLQSRSEVYAVNHVLTPQGIAREHAREMDHIARYGHVLHCT